MYIKKFLFVLGIIFILIFPTLASGSKKKSAVIINFNKELNVDSISKRCRLFANTTREVDYLKKMYYLSKKKDSVNLQCVILSHMVKNYYNRSKGDSIKYWFAKLEKVALERKCYRQFFDSYNLLCSFEVYDQDYDEALENANKLYLLAKDLNNTDGLIASYENIGIIYMETFRYVEAIKAFNEGLALLKKLKVKRYGYQFQLTSYIIESYLKLKDYKNVVENIEKAKKILKEWQNKSDDIPYNRCIWLLNSYCIEMYVGQNQPKKAVKYIDGSKDIMNGVDDNFVDAYFHYVCALYYQLIKNYPEALTSLDKIVDNEGYLPAMQLRAKLLLQSGKFKESALIYDQALAMNDSAYNESFSKQINQLRTIHEVDKLELRNNELEIASRKFKFKIVLTFASIFLVISIASVLYSIRMRCMRNRLRISDKLLKEDKRKLMKSEHDLIIAKDKAEKSSKYKDIFLANMSHEVRTPLNGIVGFSSLLTDMFEDEESAQEYVNIIKLNTEHLLKLINDTVDASSLQTGQLPFKFEQCDVRGMCQSLIDVLRMQIKDGVLLHYVPCSDETFYFVTDETRLKQLLGNLLLNSIKFTDRGDIYLKYDIDIEENQIIFTVEDTGRGVPKDMQNIIFESFEKVDVFKQGLGLGLTLVKLIAINLDGSVHIDSSYTNGTRMIFIHPIKLLK